eukprot:scaffold3791_cov137-Cylindrotheca_fusiformis.AAC.4
MSPLVMSASEHCDWLSIFNELQVCLGQQQMKVRKHKSLLLNDRVESALRIAQLVPGAFI